MTVASTVISIVVTATSASSCMDPLLWLSVRQPGGAQLSQVREPFSVPALDQNRVRLPHKSAWAVLAGVHYRIGLPMSEKWELPQIGEEVVGPAGLEPATSRLKVACSTN